jgi:hypothetical protein
VLTPWGAAGRLYGSYGVSDWRSGEFGAEVGAVPVDGVLRVLVPVRAWFGLGLVIFLAKLAAEPDIGVWIDDSLKHSAITLVLGPYGLLIGAALVVALAGRGRRAATARGVLRPVAVALFTIVMSVAVFGMQLPRQRELVTHWLSVLRDGAAELPALVRFGLSFAGLFTGPWLFVFGLCSVYLMHRNGFSHRSHPLLRPFVAVWLACAVALVEGTFGDRAGLGAVVFWIAVVAGPILTLLLGAVEVMLLRRLGLLGGRPS